MLSLIIHTPPRPTRILHATQIEEMRYTNSYKIFPGLENSQISAYELMHKMLIQANRLIFRYPQKGPRLGYTLMQIKG